MTAYSLLLSVIEFSSLSMLGWLAAAVLPWWIHRWNRRRHRTTSWAAVDLLLIALQKQARRVRFQQWLLLALRTAILVLVALAAAEPVLRQWAQGARGEGRTHRILVIDQSYSMRCKQQGISRLQRAKVQARQWIENSRGGDAFSIIRWTETAENKIGRPTFDASLVLSMLESLHPSQSTASLPAALHAVAATIDRAEQEVPSLTRHEVAFFTDLGRRSWAIENTDDDSWRSLSSALAKRASISVFNVGDDQRNNLAVTNLSVEPTIVFQQRNVDLIATLRSFGVKDWPGLTASLMVEGRQVDRQQVDVSPGGEAEVHFAYQFVDAGPHTVAVAIEGDPDGLAIDDRRWCVVNVLPQLRVACLAGKTGAADDVARALTPGKAIQSEVFPASRLEELDLSPYDVVWLCNVAGLSVREAALVAQYVRNGGGLVVQLGDQVVAERYNQFTSDQAASSFLPVRVGQLASPGDYRFDPLQYRHPIVMPFRDRETSGLLSVAVSRFFRLETSEEHLLAETVLALNTGDPALVVDRFGLGRVAVMAVPSSLSVRTPEGAPWSSFAMSPSFLPMVREMVAYLVGDRWLEQRNLLVGKPIVCLGNSSHQTVTDISVRLPDGERQTLRTQGTEDQNQIVFTKTEASGVYSVDAANNEWARFAVNLDTRESDLATVDMAALPSEFTAVDADASVELHVASASFSLARSLLTGALVLLFLEQLLAWWLGRRWG